MPHRRLLVAAALAVLAGPLGFASLDVRSQDPIAADASQRVRYDDDVVIRADLRSVRQLNLLLALEPDIWTHGVGVGPLDVRLPKTDLAILDENGIAYDVLIEDIQALVDAQYPDPVDAGEGDTGIQGDWYSDYKTWEQIDDRLEFLVGLNPDIAEIVPIGTSVEGRTINAIRIRGNTGTPSVVLNYLQHAREWVTGMSGVYTAETLVTGYGVDPYVTRLVDAIDFWIIPVVNPDGYVYTWTTQRLWRKNRRNNGGGSFGVDLNRNWGFQWGGNQGSSGNPDSDVYRGPSPFSEPETQALRDLCQSLDNFAGHMDVHSFSQLVLQPWGYTSSLPPDHPELDELGGRINAAMEAVDGKDFVHGPIYTTIYPVTGGSIDWSYGAEDALAFSPELRDEGQFGFLLPPDQIVAGAQESQAGSFALAEWIATPLDITYPAGRPDYVAPDVEASIVIDISGRDGSAYQTGSGLVWTRVGGVGEFTSTSLEGLGGSRYEATLPPAGCGETIEWYLSLLTTDGAEQFSPFGAPGEVFAAEAREVEVLFADDFEQDRGWSMTNIALEDGAWERGVPVDNDRGDPPADADGSGRCYVTDNVAANSDVDGGPTRLTSPTFDLSSGSALVRYARWFTNDDLDGDRLDVEVSNDGGDTWTTVESVPGGGGWQFAEFDVADFTSPTANVRVRFSATDNPNDSVTEAGVDAFEVIRLSCDGGLPMRLEVSPLVAGLNGVFEVFDANPNEVTYLVYSLAGLGDTFVPSLNVTLGIRQPTLAGSGQTADGSGRVTWTLPVPGNASGRTVWFQTAQFENVSNIVETVVN